MGKLAALSILIAVAFVVYFFKPETHLEVATRVAPVEQANKSTGSPATNTKTSTKTSTIPNQEAHSSPEISTEALHQHSDNHQEETEIPQYIKDQIESQRLPASELTVQQHPDGSSSIDLKGQFQHVPVAILGEDGKVKIVETRVEPKAD